MRRQNRATGLQLENQGFLPTYTSQKALQRQAVQPTQVKLELPEQACLIMGDRNQALGQLEDCANKAFQDSGAFGFRCTAEWIVKASPGSLVEVKAIAERAGTAQVAVMLQPA